MACSTALLPTRLVSKNVMLSPKTRFSCLELKTDKNLKVQRVVMSIETLVETKVVTLVIGKGLGNLLNPSKMLRYIFLTDFLE